MSGVYPFGGIYSPFGEARRNQPVDLQPCNPLPPNRMRSDVGDAGRDGYSVLSYADRTTGQRPAINGRPEYWGPRMEEET
jgi:hypothetical protein